MRRVTQGSGELIEPQKVSGPHQPHTSWFLNRWFSEFERKLAFPQTSDLNTWKQWRKKLSLALQKTLCLDQFGEVPIPRPKVLEQVYCDGYRRDKLAYETLPDNWVIAYLLIPDGGDLRPAVICPHGHVPGQKENVVGKTPPLGVAYAHEFAKRGLFVLAPENAGMGERDVNNWQKTKNSSGCTLAWARLNHMGLDLTGLRVFDLMAGLNLLRTWPGVKSSQIGCAGLSGGCWLTQVFSALDQRIKAVILSGFFTTFVQTVWHGHCVCHHPFGIGKICDLPDLSALIAPRPQFVESGMEDTPYPHEPAFSMVKQAYEFLNAISALKLHRYEGGHMFCGEKSIPWMVDVLNQ